MGFCLEHKQSTVMFESRDHRPVLARDIVPGDVERVCGLIAGVIVQETGHVVLWYFSGDIGLHSRVFNHDSVMRVVHRGSQKKRAFEHRNGMRVTIDE